METVVVTVPLKDKPGTLAGIAKVLGDNNVNVRALAVDKNGARFFTDDQARAVRLLEAHHLSPKAVEVFDLAMTDTPGELARLTEALAQEEINVVSLFGVSDIRGGHLYLRVDDHRKARPIVERFHRPMP